MSQPQYKITLLSGFFFIYFLTDSAKLTGRYWSPLKEYGVALRFYTREDARKHIETLNPAPVI